MTERSTDMEHLAGIVLAAGISSRIKRVKALLCINGQSMISRIVHMMQQAGASPVVVITGYHAIEIEQHLEGENVVFVHNTRYYETEMFDSIRLGLSVLSEEVKRVMICPTDVPLVTEKTVQTLLAADGEFVCPSYRGHSGHPVIVSSSLLPFLAHYSGERGLRGAIEAAGVEPCYITVEDRGVLLNSNTREDYNRMLGYQQGQTGRRQIQLDFDLQLNIGDFVLNSMVAQLLELIDATGSLERACTCMHQKLFWGLTTVKNLEKQLGVPILLNDSMLSSEARLLLQKYQLLHADVSYYASGAFEKLSKSDAFLNQLSGYSVGEDRRMEALSGVSLQGYE